jgi:hypothetical protein
MSGQAFEELLGSRSVPVTRCSAKGDTCIVLRVAVDPGAEGIFLSRRQGVEPCLHVSAQLVLCRAVSFIGFEDSEKIS